MQKKIFPDDEKPNYHKQIIQVYHDWFQEETGYKPNITVADAKGVKLMICWFISQEMNPIESFKSILKYWHKLDNYTQNCVDLRKINSNLNSIVKQLTKKTKKTNDKFNESIREEYGSIEGLNDFVSGEWKSSIDL